MKQRAERAEASSSVTGSHVHISHQRFLWMLEPPIHFTSTNPWAFRGQWLSSLLLNSDISCASKRTGIIKRGMTLDLNIPK
jgi:hypothetical protein